LKQVRDARGVVPQRSDPKKRGKKTTEGSRRKENSTLVRPRESPPENPG